MIGPPVEGVFDAGATAGLGYEVCLPRAGEPAPLIESSESSASARGWVARRDDDDSAPKLLAMQLSRGDRCIREEQRSTELDSDANGSLRDLGDNVGLVLGVLAACPDTPVHVSVAERHAGAFVEELRCAKLIRSAPLTLALLEEPPSQWARDHILAGADVDGTVSGLLPAVATRSELPDEVVPNDAAAAESLSEHMCLRRSKLRFQAGNLVVAADAGRGGGVLFVGETEIARNIGEVGSSESVVAALQHETGVERVIVLPNVSFHIDLDMLIAGGQVERGVLVADSVTADVLLVRGGLDRLRDSALLDRQTDSAMRVALLGREPGGEALARPLWPWLAGWQTGTGGLVGDFALAFLPRSSLAGASVRPGGEASKTDLWRCMADAHRFLAACDRLIAIADERWLDSLAEPHRSFYGALRILHSTRSEQASALAREGWKVTTIPSSPDADRSVSVLNGVRAGAALLVPSTLDRSLAGTLIRAGQQALARRMRRDPTKPVASDESQFRQGSVRCSLAVF